MEPRDGASTAGFSTASQERVTRMAPREARPPLPALTVIAHPDLERIGDRVVLGELAGGREAFLSRLQPRFAAPDGGPGRALDDLYLSRRPLRFAVRDQGDVALYLDGSRTHLAVDGEPIESACLIDRDRVDRGVVLELARRVVVLLHRLAPPLRTPPPISGLVGDSDEILRVREAIARLATHDVAVLLRGETGTGKELVARALHDLGPRRDGPFVSVNLGALAPGLAAAELFGSRKGAFTGAEDSDGYFVAAHRGTLFLDEIGEATPQVQVSLLRVLETGEVVAVGSQRPRRVDVRVVSATDADLEQRVQAGTFRAPLLHRLMTYTLTLPPLRRRRDDIGRLLVHFLRQELGECGLPAPGGPREGPPWLPAALAARLTRYDWPGNVRQLRNVTRQLVIDSHDQTTLGAGIALDELLPEPTPILARIPADASAADTLKPAGEKAGVHEAAAAPSARRRWRKPAEVTEAELVSALAEHRYELKATAAALGVSRTSLYALLERTPHVRKAADVSPAEIRQAFERHGGDLAAMVEELRLSERALRQRLKDLGLR